MTRMAVVVLAAGVAAASTSTPFRAAPLASVQPGNAASVYVAYYWRARAGQTDAYGEYIKQVAEPIDADARRAGAFVDVRTVVPAAGTTADWTHLRVFRVRDLAAAQALGAALDAATARVVPDEAARKANSTRAAGLRDFVRQEIWTDLK